MYNGVKLHGAKTVLGLETTWELMVRLTLALIIDPAYRQVDCVESRPPHWLVSFSHRASPRSTTKRPVGHKPFYPKWIYLYIDKELLIGTSLLAANFSTIS